MITVAPISVGSIDNAVKMGYGRHRDAMSDYHSGLNQFGKALGDGILSVRMADEDNRELKAQQIQQAYDKLQNGTATKEDVLQLNKLLGVAAPLTTNYEELPDDLEYDENYLNQARLNMIELPVYTGDESSASGVMPDVDVKTIGMSSMPDYLSNDPSIEEEKQKTLASEAAKKFLEENAQRGTVQRAMERAGLATGHMKMSEQDEMVAKQNHELNMLGIKNKAELEKWMAQNGLQGMDIPTAALYRAVLGGGEVNDNVKGLFAQKFGYNSSLQNAMNGLEQFAETDSAGNLSEKAQKALGTAGQALADRLNEASKAALKEAGNLKTPEAEAKKSMGYRLGAASRQISDRVKSNAGKLGKDAMLVLATAIENAFGINKQAAQIEINKLIAESSRAYDPEKMKQYLASGNPIAANELNYGVPQVEQPMEQQSITEAQFESYLYNMSDEQLKAFMERMGMI